MTRHSIAWAKTAVFRLDLLGELFAPQPNQEIIQQILSELEQKLGQFEREMLKHFQDMIAICDQQQAEELKFILIELMERTRPHPPQEHRRGPDGGLMPDHSEDRLEHNGDFRPHQGPPPRR